MLLYYYYFK